MIPIIGIMDFFCYVHFINHVLKFIETELGSLYALMQ